MIAYMRNLKKKNDMNELIYKQNRNRVIGVENKPYELPREGEVN